MCGDYRQYHLCSMGPPSSGGIAVLQILGMLQRFPSEQLTPGTVSGAHLFAEASRLAYADRAQYLGDPAFVDVPIAGADRQGLSCQPRRADRSLQSDMGTALAGDPPQKHAALSPQVSPVLHGTSHMTIVDDTGEVVAMTTSVESVFGARDHDQGLSCSTTR